MDDPYPTVTLVSGIKDRLQSQQKAMRKSAPKDDINMLHIRAELDALWTCVEVLAQSIDGIPEDRMIIHDYFTET